MYSRFVVAHSNRLYNSDHVSLVIQFIITAKNLPEESKYLNLRLRMEQQRLFAWSETSGLLDL
jgi:hypothetical protein